MILFKLFFCVFSLLILSFLTGQVCRGENNEHSTSSFTVYTSNQFRDIPQEHFYRCKPSYSTASVISIEDLCNGIKDCPSGDDELNCHHEEDSYYIMPNNNFHLSQFLRVKRSPRRRRFKEGIEILPQKQVKNHQKASRGRTLTLLDVNFITYERSNSTQPLSPPLSFKDNSKVAFYIHGFYTASLEDGVGVRNALLQNTTDVDYVVLVDWRKLSLPPHFSLNVIGDYRRTALQNVPIVAQKTKDFILQHLNDRHNIHIVGFSLGGQIAGIASRSVAASGNLTIDRITGLDPAGPIFEHSLMLLEVDTSQTIRPSDASFVDIIHTSSILGMVNPAGHLDTFVLQNYCIDGMLGAICRHSMANQVFISSINSCSLITCPAQKGTNGCSPKEMSSCGYLADKYESRGVHNLYLTISANGNWRDPKCSEYKNVYLPVKQRYCQDTFESCGVKSYMSQCEFRCRVANTAPRNADADKQAICSLDSSSKLAWACPS